MRATVEIAGVQATIQGWRWSSDSNVLTAILNSMLDPLGPSGSDPAPSLHAAQETVALLGGKVIDYELPEYVEGRVY